MEGAGQERPSLIHTASLILMPGLYFFGGLFACGVKRSGRPDAELKSASGQEAPEGYPYAKSPDILLEKKGLEGQMRNLNRRTKIWH